MTFTSTIKIFYKLDELSTDSIKIDSHLMLPDVYSFKSFKICLFTGKTHGDKLRNYELKTFFRLKPTAFVSGDK